MEAHRYTRSAHTFKLLTILGCAGTLVFLLLEAYRENFGGLWVAWQTRYAQALPDDLASAFEPGIKQAFLPELDRVDRCQTCHVGIDDPTMVDEEPPLRTHPGDLLAFHPVERFGCTICHQGQGRATTFAAAHGDVPHWEEPLLRGDLIYTTCGRCHAENAPFGLERELFAGGQRDVGELVIRDTELAASIPGSETLRRGKKLFVSSGCLGCHAYRGVGGALGPDLTHVGDKGVHGYDFSHLPPGVERTPIAWLIEHFMDPSAVSPETVMPGFGASRGDAEALAAYMLSLKSPDLPSSYRPAPRVAGGEPVGGARLYELFCIACHGPDLAGSGVPAIRTPSLSNEDFLSIANEHYLTSIIANGRIGTEMPAWGAATGGLSDAQIAQLVEYVRGHYPERSTAADVSRSAGDAGFGRSIYRGNCAACHGLFGEGGIGPRLNSPDFLALASDDFLVRTLLDGRPAAGMPSWRNLAPRKLSDLLAYLRSWERDAARPEDVLAYLDTGAADPHMGARLYRARCATCHGRDAEGMIGPSLGNENFLSIVPDAFLAAVILEGRPGTAMPAWKDLSAADVGDVIAHLRSAYPVELREPPAQIAQGDPDNGGLLFARVCASCHGREAVGGTGPQLRNPVFLAQASDGYLYETIAHGRPGTPMRGLLKGSGTGADRVRGAAGMVDFTPGQIADVVAWLRRLEYAAPSRAPAPPMLGSASRGREIFEQSGGCASCHGPQGQGAVGPAIGGSAFHEQASPGFLLGTLVLGRSGTEMRDFAANGIADLDAEGILDVAAYLQTLPFVQPPGAEGARIFHSTADRVAHGQELYRLYCSACHGTDGRGGYAPELNNAEFLAAASDGFLVATIARGRERTPMRAFGPGAAGLAELTSNDIRAIVAFLRSWQGAPFTERTDTSAPPAELPEN